MTTVDQAFGAIPLQALRAPQTFRHLLRAYPLLGIDEREVVAIDAGNANLVVPHGQGQRLADAVWRLMLADGEIVYLLIECQAEIDPSMPFRMLHAAAGMYLILSQNPPRESGYTASLVPCVKHLIIYSGKRPWTAGRRGGAGDQCAQFGGGAGHPEDAVPAA